MHTPATEDILAVLRQLLPELQTRFAVSRIGVYGYHTKPNALLASNSRAVNVLVECTEPLGTEFSTLQQLLQQKIGWPVRLKSPAMLTGTISAAELATAVYA